LKAGANTNICSTLKLGNVLVCVGQMEEETPLQYIKAIRNGCGEFFEFIYNDYTKTNIDSIITVLETYEKLKQDSERININLASYFISNIKYTNIHYLISLGRN